MFESPKTLRRRVSLPPARSPDASLVIKSGAMKDTPEKLSFYSNAVYAGEIGAGKTTSKKKTAELAAKHNVSNPALSSDSRSELSRVDGSAASSVRTTA